VPPFAASPGANVAGVLLSLSGRHKNESMASRYHTLGALVEQHCKPCRTVLWPACSEPRDVQEREHGRKQVPYTMPPLCTVSDCTVLYCTLLN